MTKQKLRRVRKKPIPPPLSFDTCILSMSKLLKRALAELSLYTHHRELCDDIIRVQDFAKVYIDALSEDINEYTESEPGDEDLKDLEFLPLTDEDDLDG